MSSRASVGCGGGRRGNGAEDKRNEERTRSDDSVAVGEHRLGVLPRSDVLSGVGIEDDEIGEPELDRCPRCSAPLHGHENYCPRCSAQLGGREEPPETVLAGLLNRRDIEDPGWADDWQTAIQKLSNQDVTAEQVRETVRVIPDQQLEGKMTGWQRQRLREKYGVDV